MDDRIEAREPQDMGASTIGGAQQIIADMLVPEEDKTEQVSEAVDESLEGEVLEDDAEYEEADEALDSEDDDIDLDDDEYEQEEEAEPAAKTFTVKVAGEEVEVGLDELKNGYSRQADYTKKAQALAEERKQFTQDRDAVLLERQQYAQLLGALQQQLATDQTQQPDFDRLYEEDPIEAARLERKWTQQQQAKQQKMQAIALEQQRVREANAQEQQQQMRGLIEQEVQRLPEVIPEWKDEKRASKERDELRAYLTEQGVNEEEMNALVRANHIAVLRKAMLYDKGRRRVKSAEKEGRKTRAAKPGSRAGQQPASKRRTKVAYQRLAKSGKRDDAAALLESLL
jgi:hypothetical protein